MGVIKGLYEPAEGIPVISGLIIQHPKVIAQADELVEVAQSFPELISPLIEGSGSGVVALIRFHHTQVHLHQGGVPLVVLFEVTC